MSPSIIVNHLTFYIYESNTWFEIDEDLHSLGHEDKLLKPVRSEKLMDYSVTGTSGWD